MAEILTTGLPFLFFLASSISSALRAVFSSDNSRRRAYPYPSSGTPGCCRSDCARILRSWTRTLPGPHSAPRTPCRGWRRTAVSHDTGSARGAAAGLCRTPSAPPPGCHCGRRPPPAGPIPARPPQWDG